MFVVELHEIKCIACISWFETHALTARCCEFWWNNTRIENSCIYNSLFAWEYSAQWRKLIDFFLLDNKFRLNLTIFYMIKILYVKKLIYMIKTNLYDKKLIQLTHRLEIINCGQKVWRVILNISYLEACI